MLMRFVVCIILIVCCLAVSREPDFTFVAYADPRVTQMHNDYIVPLILQQNPKFVICMGDIASDPGSVSGWNSLLAQIDPIKNAGIAYFPVYGNHEGPSSAYQTVWNPRLTPYTTEFNINFGPDGCQYYTFEFKNWVFVIRDVVNKEGGNWLVNTLSQVDNDNKFLVVCQHYPTFGIALGMCANEGNGKPEHQSYYIPYGVNFVLMGHIHYFYKTIVNGITYVESSGGGRSLRRGDPACMYPGDLTFSDFHITRVDVYGKGAVCTAIDKGGTIQAQFTIGDTAGGTTKIQKNGVHETEKVTLECFPNPMAKKSWIHLSGSVNEFAEISIYDIKGRKIKGLFKGRNSYGHIRIFWTGNDDYDKKVIPGMYIIRCNTGEKSINKKIVWSG